MWLCFWQDTVSHLIRNLPLLCQLESPPPFQVRPYTTIFIDYAYGTLEPSLSVSPSLSLTPLPFSWTQAGQDVREQDGGDFYYN